VHHPIRFIRQQRNPFASSRKLRTAGIKNRIGIQRFRVTGIATYLKNRGKPETAQHIQIKESRAEQGRVGATIL
jgi:hypothetical protein